MRLAPMLGFAAALIGASTIPTAVRAGPPGQPKPITVPYDGKGTLVMGSAMLIGGSTLTGLGIGLQVDGRYPGWALTGMVVGIAGIGAGLATTGVGILRQSKYRAWQLETGLRPPRQGNGLFGAMAVTMVGTGGAFVFTTLGGLPDRWMPAGFALGGAGVLATGLLFYAALSTNLEFDRWRKGRVRMMPTASFGPHGLQLGLVGRF